MASNCSLRETWLPMKESNLAPTGRALRTTYLQRETLPLLVKQTLLLLQFPLLCVDQLGELKLQRDWTYDCMHCLVFFLYQELEQFNISKASSFLYSPQKEGNVVLLTGLRFPTIVPGHNMYKFIHITNLVTRSLGCIKGTFLVTLRVLIEPTIVLIPPGATSKVQPLDVAVNSEFKKAVDRPATEAMTRDLDQFLTGTVTASERRIFCTKWTRQAWQDVSRRLRDTITRSLWNVGLPCPLISAGWRTIQLAIPAIRNKYGFTTKIDD